LSQLLLKLTSPGVPDFYQGSELWDFRLVDPDNRRLVDFQLRNQIHQQVKSKSPLGREGLQDLLLQPETGAVKMFVISRVLAFRNSHPDLFRFGNYLPLEALGEKADHVVAFAREYKKDHLIVLAPRLMAGLMDGQERLPLGESTWTKT